MLRIGMNSAAIEWKAYRQYLVTEMRARRLMSLYARKVSRAPPVRVVFQLFLCKKQHSVLLGCNLSDLDT